MSKIRQFDNVLRWFVPSHSRNIDHLVDLENYGGNGSCTCEHFTFTLERILQKGAKPGDEWRCKHIIQARAALADLLIAEKLKKRGKKR